MVDKLNGFVEGGDKGAGRGGDDGGVEERWEVRTSGGTDTLRLECTDSAGPRSRTSTTHQQSRRSPQTLLKVVHYVNNIYFLFGLNKESYISCIVISCPVQHSLDV